MDDLIDRVFNPPAPPEPPAEHKEGENPNSILADNIFQPNRQQQLVEKRLAEMRSEGGTMQGEPLGAYLTRRAVPFVASLRTYEEGKDYRGAVERLNQRTAWPSDIEAAARHQYLREVEAGRGTGAKIVSGLASIPAILGESAVMPGGQVVSAAEAGPSLLTRAGLIGAAKRAPLYAAEKALQTPAMPSLYVGEAERRAEEHGGSPGDVRNMAPALALGAIQNIILGTASESASGVPTMVGRLGARTAIGMAEQQGADVLASAVSETLPEAYKLETGYGLAGEFVKSARGDKEARPLQHATVQAATFAAFSLMHGGKSPMEKFTEATNELAKAGFSEAAAAQIMADPSKPPPLPDKVAEKVSGYAKAVQDVLQMQQREAAETARLKQAAGPGPEKRPISALPPVAESNTPAVEPQQGVSAESTQSAIENKQPVLEPPSPLTVARDRLAAAQEAENRERAKASSGLNANVAGARKARLAAEKAVEEAQGWPGYKTMPPLEPGQPQEGPQQPRSEPIAPTPPTAGAARGRREAASDEQTLGQWMDERRGLSAENDASFAETMRRSGMSESEVQQALSGMRQRLADARAAAARSRDFRRQADEAAPEAAPPAAPAAGERYYRVPDSKGVGSNADAAIRELAGKEFANKWFSRTREGNEGYFTAGKVQFEFANEHLGGEHDVVERRERDVGIGSKAPMYMHKALAEIRFNGTADAPEFGRLNDLITDANKQRAEAGLPPIKLTATAERKVAEPVKAAEPPPPEKAPEAAPAKLNPTTLLERLQANELIPGISPAQQRDLYQHHVEGKTLAQIAEERGVSRQAVAQSIERALEKLHGTIDEPPPPTVAAGSKEKAAAFGELSANEWQRTSPYDKALDHLHTQLQQEMEANGGTLSHERAVFYATESAALEAEHDSAGSNRKGPALKRAIARYRAAQAGAEPAAPEAAADRPAAPGPGQAETPAGREAGPPVAGRNAEPTAAGQPPTERGVGGIGRSLLELDKPPLPGYAAGRGKQQGMDFGNPEIPYSNVNWMNAATDLAPPGQKVTFEQPNIAVIGGKNYRVELVKGDWKLTLDSAARGAETRAANREQAALDKAAWHKEAQDLGATPADVDAQAKEIIAADAQDVQRRAELYDQAAAALDAHGKQWRMQAANEARGGEQGRGEDEWPGQDEVAGTLKMSEDQLRQLMVSRPEAITETQAYEDALARIAAAAQADAEAAARDAGFSAAAIKESRRRGEAAADAEAQGDAAEPTSGDTGFDFGANQPPGSVGAATALPPSPTPPPGTPGAEAPIPPPPERPAKSAVAWFRSAKDFISSLAQKSYPSLTRLSPRAGELLAETANAKAAAKAVWAYMSTAIEIGRTRLADLVPEDLRELGATWLEMRMRHERERLNAEFNAALAKATTPEERQAALEIRLARDEVRTLIGTKGSPLKDEAQFDENMRHLFGFFDQIRQHWTPEVDRNYEGITGRDPNDPNNVQSQIPGLPLNAIALDPNAPGAVSTGGGKAQSLANLKIRKPGMTRHASLSAEAYDVNLHTMMQRTLMDGISAARKAEFVRQAIKDGVIQAVAKGEAPNKGWEYLALDPARGLKGLDPEAMYYVDPVAAKDVEQGLGIGRRPGQLLAGGVKPAMDVAYNIALLAPVELATHVGNQFTAMFRPGMGNPLVALGRSAREMIRLVQNDPESLRKVAELTKMSAAFGHEAKPGWGQSLVGLGEYLPGANAEKVQALAERVGKYDPTTYFNKITSGAIDIMQKAVRIQLSEAYDRVVAAGEFKDTPGGKRDFINQAVGNYNAQAGNRIAQFLKDSGLQSFATAAHTFTAQGVKSLWGGAINAQAASPRAALALRSRAVLKLLPVMALGPVINSLVWGQAFPQGVPVFAVKTRDDEEGTHYFDQLAFTGLRRGARATGVNAVVEGMRQGETGGQIADRAGSDFLLSGAHAVAGPPAQAAYTATTGKDLLGRTVAEQVSKATTNEGIRQAAREGKPLPGESQKFYNAKAALVGLNPVSKVLSERETAKQPKSWWQAVMQSAGPFGEKTKAPPPAKKR